MTLQSDLPSWTFRGLLPIPCQWRQRCIRCSRLRFLSRLRFHLSLSVQSVNQITRLFSTPAQYTAIQSSLSSISRSVRGGREIGPNWSVCTVRGLGREACLFARLPWAFICSERLFALSVYLLWAFICSEARGGGFMPGKNKKAMQLPPSSLSL